jgi:ABC-type sugar transport system permease subunit
MEDHLRVTHRVNPSAPTQVFTVGSLPTLPRDVQTSSIRARTVGRTLMISPVMLYFVLIAIFWACFTRNTLGTLQASVDNVRRAMEDKYVVEE